MKIAAIASAGMLVACATASPIQPIGNDLYSITADSRALGATVASTRANALSQANAFCAAKRLTMVADNIEDQ